MVCQLLKMVVPAEEPVVLPLQKFLGCSKWFSQKAALRGSSKGAEHLGKNVLGCWVTHLSG